MWDKADPPDPALVNLWLDPAESILKRYDGSGWTDAGIVGATGEKGDKGDPGEPGESIQGEKGETGESRVQRGEAAPRGEKGAPGERGPKGVKGDKGDKGERGLKGEVGERGAAWSLGTQRGARPLHDRWARRRFLDKHPNRPHLWPKGRRAVARGRVLEGSEGPNGFSWLTGTARRTRWWRGWRRRR